jgi:predicted GNAT family N-acyltransferase
VTPNRASLRVTRFDGRAAGDAKTAAALEESRAIRFAVFVQEQHVPARLEWDGLDEEAEHFLVHDANAQPPQPLGTARFRVAEAVGKAERVAVLETARGRGLGRLLMDAIASRARELGLSTIRLNAQVGVLPFYERLGYRAEGEVFVEAGIDHRAMIRSLS